MFAIEQNTDDGLSGTSIHDHLNARKSNNGHKEQSQQKVTKKINQLYACLKKSQGVIITLFLSTS